MKEGSNMKWPHGLLSLWPGLAGALGIGLGVLALLELRPEDTLAIIALSAGLFLSFPRRSTLTGYLHASLGLVALWVFGLPVAVLSALLSVLAVTLSGSPVHGMALAARSTLPLVLANQALALGAPGSQGPMVLAGALYLLAFSLLDPWPTQGPAMRITALVACAAVSGLAYLAWHRLGPGGLCLILTGALLAGVTHEYLFGRPSSETLGKEHAEGAPGAVTGDEGGAPHPGRGPSFTGTGQMPAGTAQVCPGAKPLTPRSPVVLRLLKEVRHKNKTRMALWDFARQVSGTGEPSTVCRAAEAAARRVIPGASVALFLQDGDGYRVYMGDGALAGIVPRSGPLAEASSQGSIVHSWDLVREWPSAPEALRCFDRGVTIPLCLDCQPLGVMGVYLQGREFQRSEVCFLRGMAGFASMSLANGMLLEEARTSLKELSSMKRFNDLVLESVSSAILVVDTNGEPMLANGKAKELLESLKGFVPGKDEAGARPPLMEVMARAMERGEEVTVNRQAFPGPGGRQFLNGSVAPLRSEDGEVMGAVGVFHDVTAIVSLEREIQQAEKMALLGELAAGAAHEIKNPLAAIKGFVQLLGRDLSGPKARYLRIVLAEIDRMTRIVEDLLIMARPQPDLAKSFDPNGVVGDTWEAWRDRASALGVDLGVSLSGSVPAVKGEESQIKQVLYNLVANALDATGAGGNIVLSTRACQGWAVITVRDDGNGIHPSQMQAIFNPFYTTKEGGTGLGLSVSYRIIQAHQGKMDVESSPGQGTTVTVYLPQCNPAQAGDLDLPGTACPVQ